MFPVVVQSVRFSAIRWAQTTASSGSRFIGRVAFFRCNIVPLVCFWIVIGVRVLVHVGDTGRDTGLANVLSFPFFRGQSGFHLVKFIAGGYPLSLTIGFIPLPLIVATIPRAVSFCSRFVFIMSILLRQSWDPE